MATMKYWLFRVLLYAIPVAARTSVFHTNSTIPPADSTYIFVTSPNTRGTLQILWSCLFTALICTWTVQHLNVPPQNISALRLFLRKPIWMIVTLLAPEFIGGLALQEFLLARASVKLMRNTPGCRELVKRGGWTMTHAFYAHMGGFMLRERIPGPPDPAVSKVEALFDVMTPRTPMITFRPFVRVGVTEIVSCLQSGLLRSPPDFITRRQIRDRAKGDMLLKCIEALQVFWFIVQVCVRRARNLPTSQLEIGVLAFCASTITSYALWWNKPQHLSVPSYLDATRALTDEERQNLYDSSRDTENFLGYEHLRSSPPSDDFRFKVKSLDLQRYGFAVWGMVFGAIPMLAWNAHFPTEIERSLWRCCSITATVVPPILLFLLVAANRGWDTVMRGLETLSRFIAALMLLVYAVCRVYLVVETLRSIGFLPRGAFATAWTTYMPHVI